MTLSESNTAELQRQDLLGPTELALLNNRLDGILRAMMNTLRRSARSVILSAARDCSCAILTTSGELLAVADSIPIHVFRGADLMARSMMKFHPILRRGDAFLHNSPYHGNSHAADWSILVPVIDDKGVHRFTLLSKGHLSDTGNSIPATSHLRAKDVYEEGALIFPAVRVQENYRDIDDIINICRMRIRNPELWYGDYQALVGSTRVGEQQLLELLEEVGIDALDQYSKQWLDYSEQKMAAALSRMPEGTVTCSGRYDPVPGFPEGIPVNVSVSIDPRRKKAVVDLRDNIDCIPNGLNLSEATAATAALIGVFASLGEYVPTNAGSFRCVEVLLRENCVLGIAQHPTSCSMATTHLAERVAKQVTMAMAQFGDGYGMAEVGATLPAAWAKISGVDPRKGGRSFTDGLCLGTTHGAGSPTADGWLTLAGIGAAGTMMRDSIEFDELKFPIIIHEERIISDSEGAGRFRGAHGAQVEFGPLGTSLEVIGGSDGTHFASRGARGGGMGAPAAQFKRELNGELSEDLGWGFRIRLMPGETLVSRCCGGGGYGPPETRDAAMVLHDVREGKVSAQRARDVYRVGITANGELNPVLTEELRKHSESKGQSQA